MSNSLYNNSLITALKLLDQRVDQENDSRINKNLIQLGTALSLQATQTFQHIENKNNYILITVTNLTATESEYVPTVVYKNVETLEIWSRPLKEFLINFTQI